MSSVDILVPDLPESIANATITTWHKKPDGAVVRDEVLVEIETDKVVLKVPASADGILSAVLEDEDTTVTSRQILGYLREGSNTGRETSAKSEEKAFTPAQHQQVSLEGQNNDALSPAIRRLLTGHNLDINAIKDTGVGSRLTRGDMERHLTKALAKESTPAATDPVAQPALTVRSEKRVPMTCLRKRVVECLLETENSTAVLTTFNEVNVRPIMNLRKQYGGAFEKRHGIRLGLISFYVKAVVEALKRYLGVNASIDNDDVVYHNYFDVSTAVSTPYGLVTLVLRDVDTLSMADIEKEIKELAIKGRDDKSTVEDLTGGDFTITDGGMFSSLVSTSIINSPQSVILDMHTIKDRPMTMNGQVEILPMMYLALSYDHHLIDGREPVGFLIAIKELLEDSTRLLLDVQQLELYLHCRPTWIGCRSTV